MKKEIEQRRKLAENVATEIDTAARNDLRRDNELRDFTDARTLPRAARGSGALGAGRQGTDSNSQSPIANQQSAINNQQSANNHRTNQQSGPLTDLSPRGRENRAA
jgi:hypothetical protein